MPVAQTGFVPGRAISNNVIIAYDVIYWRKRHCPDATLLLPNFFETYSSVQWPFLQMTLTNFRFGPVCVQFITKWYQTRTSALAINGHFTKMFNILKEVQKGNSVSTFLFHSNGFLMHNDWVTWNIRQHLNGEWYYNTYRSFLCRQLAHHFKITGSCLSYLLYCREVLPRLWSPSSSRKVRSHTH